MAHTHTFHFIKRDTCFLKFLMFLWISQPCAINNSEICYCLFNVYKWPLFILGIFFIGLLKKVTRSVLKYMFKTQFLVHSSRIPKEIKHLISEHGKIENITICQQLNLWSVLCSINASTGLQCRQKAFFLSFRSSALLHFYKLCVHVYG